MGKKFYAVRVGYNPGIYETWEECQEQVFGYSRCEYRGFNNLAEARAYMGQEEPRSGGSRSGATNKKFYAVRVGHNPGIYTTWEACREEVLGYSRADFRAFESLEEARAYLRGAVEPHYEMCVSAWVVPQASTTTRPQPAAPSRQERYLLANSLYEDEELYDEHDQEEHDVLMRIARKLDAMLYPDVTATEMRETISRVLAIISDRSEDLLSRQ